MKIYAIFVTDIVRKKGKERNEKIDRTRIEKNKKKEKQMSRKRKSYFTKDFLIEFRGCFSRKNKTQKKQ